MFADHVTQNACSSGDSVPVFKRFALYQERIPSLFAKTDKIDVYVVNRSGSDSRRTD